MTSGSVTLGSIAGIEIRVHVSWLLIAALVAWNFWGRFTLVEGEDDLVALAMAVSAAVLFFVSILVHELAHSLEAKHRGVKVHGITLFLFGGATETKFDVRRPVDELALTAVGPFTSFVLAAGLGLLSMAADAGGLDRVAAVAGLIGWLNLALGIFNLLPGAPLDGGRILRAIVWWISKDRDKAVRVAARSGQVLGGLLVGLGVLQLLAVEGAGVGGLWLAFIGWFLMRAAQAELTHHVLSRSLEDVPVRRIVGESSPIPAETSVEDAIEGWFEPYDAEVFAVVRGERPVGVVGVDQVRSVGRGDRAGVRIGEVMESIDDVPTVDARENAGDLVDRLQTSPVALALDGDRIVGVVTARRLANYVERSQRLERVGR